MRSSSTKFCLYKKHGYKKHEAEIPKNLRSMQEILAG